MVVIDIARPGLRLLQDRCEVGVGASDPMRKILEEEGVLEPKEQRPRVKPEPGAQVYPSLKEGIVAVKINNVQLIQVTKGMAGSLDRAHKIATELAAAANDGVTDKEKLTKRRQALFGDPALKVPALGLDAKAKELLSGA